MPPKLLTVTIFKSRLKQEITILVVSGYFYSISLQYLLLVNLMHAR